MRTKMLIVATGLGLLMLLPGVGATKAHAAEIGLAWSAPTNNIDGSPLADLAGFRVCFGAESGVYTTTQDVGKVQSVILQDLNPYATYYIAVKAYAESGIESDASKELVWAFDSDADELPDDWERYHFGSLSEVRTGVNEDYDGDGVANGDEYVAGTDPTDARDFAAVRFTRGVDGLLLSFKTMTASGPGYLGKTRTYTLEQCTDLAANAWNSLPDGGNIPATGETAEVRVAASNSGYGFYRTLIRLE